MRQLTQIHGGVHPPFHKDESTALPIKDAGIPAQLILSLQQHIGAPAEPVVAVGDKVLKGQVIAVAMHDKISANIHAPSSGIISAIEDHVQPHASNLAELCIIIDTDGKDEWLNDKDKLAPLPDYTSIDTEILLERINQAGIVGLGGAVFPTAVKLLGANKATINTFIINGAADRVVPPASVVDLSDKLKEQKGITITHTEIEGAGHFFDPGMDEMLGNVDEYVRRRMTETTR